jgi:hypothetical protein
LRAKTGEQPAAKCSFLQLLALGNNRRQLMPTDIGSGIVAAQRGGKPHPSCGLPTVQKIAQIYWGGRQ